MEVDSKTKSFILINVLIAVDEMKQELNVYIAKYGENKTAIKAKDRINKIKKLIDAFSKQ